MTLLLALAAVELPVAAAESSPGAAAELGAQRELDSIDKRILDCELELFGINALIRQHTQPSSMWEARRWAAYGISNNALTAAGAMINSVERLRVQKNAKKINRRTIIEAARLRILANCISTVGATAEFAKEQIMYRWHARHGFNPKALTKRVLELHDEIDKLLTQRSAVQKNCSIATYQEQGEILTELRSLSLSQFARFYGEFRGSRIRKQIGYILTAGSNAVSGAGSYVGVVATRERREKLGGTGGFTDSISGGINILIPVAVRVGDWAQRRVTQSIYCRKLGCERVYSLAAIRTHIGHMRQKDSVAGEDPAMLEDEKILAHLEQIVEDQEKLRLHSIKVAHRHLAENETNAIVGGGAKVTNGIGTLMGTYHKYRNRHDKLRVTGAASLVYSLGNMVSGAELLRAHLCNEYKFHEQGKTGQRPVQVWKKQVEAIKGMRTELDNVER